MKQIPAVLMTAVAVVVAGRFGAPAGAKAPRADQVRTAFFSATDSKGNAVSDLTATDIAVKEGGKDRQVASLKLATAPLDVAILVDDQGTGGFQGGVVQLFQAMLDRARFSIRILNPQSLLIQDYTQDVAALKTALGRIGPRGRVQVDPDQIIEAIAEAARELQQRKAQRPVILALTVGGDSDASSNLDAVLDQLKNSRACLNLIHLANASIGRVLGDGPKFSGGRSETIGSSLGIAPAIAKIVDHLKNQYELSYTLPEGVKPNDRLAITTTRRGVSLIAPTRVPDK
jgi:hypothetical protein